MRTYDAVRFPLKRRENKSVSKTRFRLLHSCVFDPPFSIHSLTDGKKHSTQTKPNTIEAEGGIP